MIFLIGQGYDQSIESDILLLDISNNDEYAWTTSFVPLSPSSPTPSSTVSSTLVSTATIGTSIGVIGGILNILPYIGGIIAIALPVLMVTVAREGFAGQLLVIGSYLVIQFIRVS